MTEAERKKNRAKSQRSGQIGLLLQSEKQTACAEVEQRERHIDSPRAVKLGDAIIAWVYVEATRHKGYASKPGEVSYCGFVYLTPAGYDLIDTPWSPAS